MEKHWQLPTRQSNLTNKDWIHPKAKFHCFEGEEQNQHYIGGESLCRNHYQVTRDFEDYRLDYILENYGVKAICPKCYKLYLERNGDNIYKLIAFMEETMYHPNVYTITSFNDSDKIYVWKKEDMSLVTIHSKEDMVKRMKEYENEQI